LVGVLRRRPAYLVVVAIWLLGLAALASVLVLQGRLDQRRRAQIAVVNVRMQLGVLPKTALDLNGNLSRQQVQGKLAVAERQLATTAKSLDGLAGNRSDSRLIMRQAAALFPLLARANDIASEGYLRTATVMLGLSLLPGAPAYRLNQTLDSIGAKYGHEASSARRLVDIGSALAIVLLLVAFSIVLWRASRLAGEKHCLLEQSRRDALTDELTGLANRRKLFADLAELVGSGEEEPAVVGVLDLDGFKSYNDRFGHPAGDELLARMGRALRLAVGDWGVAYRMGGDEFCVVATGLGAETALERARDVLCARVGGLSISCSLGAARFAADGSTADALLRKADERLYEEKRASRIGREPDADEAPTRHAFVA
jgi:diguanylate cyclase (GGDEF)-like protein